MKVGDKNQSLPPFPQVAFEQWLQEALRSDGTEAKSFESLCANSIEGFSILPLYGRENCKGKLVEPYASPGRWEALLQISASTKPTELELEWLLGLDGILLEEGSDISGWLAALAAIKDAPAIKLYLPCEFQTDKVDRVLANIPKKFLPTLEGAFLFSSSHDTAQWREVIAAAKKIQSKLPKIKSLGVDVRWAGNAGASAVQELAIISACIIDLSRVAFHQSADIGSLLNSMQLAVSVGPDFFVEVSKGRALRQLLRKISKELGQTVQADSIPVLASGVVWNHTEADPYLNLVRQTAQMTAAASAGYTAIASAPCLPKADPQQALSLRLARNIHHILAAEAHVAAVADPGAGSWYVETLTTELCQHAWDLVQKIEGHGGYASALQNGFIEKQISQTRQQRIAHFTNGTDVLVGVNKYSSGQSGAVAPAQSGTPLAPLSLEAIYQAGKGAARVE